MASTIKLRRSAVSGRIPTIGTLELGELAMNTYDGDIFFKKDQTATQGGTESIVRLTTVDGDQTLTNKTISDPTITSLGTAGEFAIVNGTKKIASTPNLRIDSGTGAVEISQAYKLPTSDGFNGAFLKTDGQGQTSFGTLGLDDLTDVNVSVATANQVLKYNGSIWSAADNDAAVASAIFAPQAQTDLGFVNEPSNAATDEDLGFVYETTQFIYDLGQLKLDGIVSLSNIDQSVKADYIGYAIIFGF